MKHQGILVASLLSMFLGMSTLGSQETPKVQLTTTNRIDFEALYLQQIQADYFHNLTLMEQLASKPAILRKMNNEKSAYTFLIFRTTHHQ